MQIQLRLISVLCLVMLWGCREDIDSVDSYAAWLNDPAHKLVQSKVINGLEITVKYLPPEYMAYQDIRNSGNPSARYRDSIVHLYRRNIHFLLSFGFYDDDQRNADVMTNGVGSYSEFAERVLDMNFGMEERIMLKMDGRECRPVLTALENTYGLKGRRDIVVAFSPETGRPGRGETVDFVLYDDIFETGISHFVFSGSHLHDMAGFPFENSNY